jgi:VWFA-related protein
MALSPRTAAVLIFGSLVLRAQAPAQEVTIHTHSYTPPSMVLHAESNLVEAGLIVRDSQGRAVAGLHASDFEVSDNGVLEQITAFSELRSDGPPNPPTAAPLSRAGAETVPPAAVPPPESRFVTFFFDDFHGGAGLFVAKAARAFIAKGLRPSDRISIVTASGEGDLDFTNDAKLFAEKLDHVHLHTRAVVPSRCGVSPIDSYIFLHNLDGQIREAAIGAAMPCACFGGETQQSCRPKAIAVAQQAASSAWEQLHMQSLDTLDALKFAAKRLSEMHGVRILVLTSSGMLLRPGVPPELQTFLDAAVRANIVVDAIDAQGLIAPGAMDDTKAGMRRDLPRMTLQNIANATGGHFFKNNNDLAAAMELAANPDVSYLLAFNPGGHDGKFHTLKIRFKSKRPETLQFRPGYTSPEDKPVPPSTRAPLDAAVFSKETLQDVPATVALAAGQPKDDTIAVSVTFIVDVNRLQFGSADGRHMQQIIFLIALFDAKGGYVMGKESIMDLALTDERLASLEKTGLKTVATLNAPAGDYQVRAIVREGMKGSLTASTLPVGLRGN